MAGTLGVLPYHVYDAVELAAVAWSRWDVSQDDVQDAAQLIEERRQQRQQSSPVFGAAMGRNLIIVQAESLQQFVLGLRIGDRLVTPALDAFAMESVRFSNFHEQTWLGATSDAMFTALHSLHALPPGHGAVATRFLTNVYQGLPNLLAQHGYSTFAAMGAPGRFWHIDRLWTRLGFQRTAYDHDYPGSERFGQGIADVPFFEQTAARLTQLQTPFMAFLVSVSTHIPFDLPPAERRLDLGALSGTTLGKYLDSISYFDRAFGRFLSELARTGLLETSVIVVYGDHEAWLGPSPALAAFTAPSGNPEFGYWRSRKRVPLLIRLPSGKMSGQRDVAGGQLDIAPTLLSLLGVRAPQAIMLGADLFQPRETPVVFRDGSVLHGNLYLVQGLGAGRFSCYEAGSGRVVGCAPAPGGLDAATRELQASDFILYGDLVPRLIATSTATAH